MPMHYFSIGLRFDITDFYSDGFKVLVSCCDALFDRMFEREDWPTVNKKWREFYVSMKWSYGMNKTFCSKIQISLAFDLFVFFLPMNETFSGEIVLIID